MSIANVVTRGYGPSAGIKWILTKGYFNATAVPSANLTGSNLTAAVIVAGGAIITLTLVNATWNVAGTAFDNARQAIIDGLNSVGIEANGWNVEVRDKEVVGAVVRTSDTVVTITLTAAPLYSITASETITPTIPASAISDASSIVATPTFNAGVVASTGELYGNLAAWFLLN